MTTCAFAASAARRARDLARLEAAAGSDFAQRMRQARRAAGISQSELAELVGWAEYRTSEIESGLRRATEKEQHVIEQHLDLPEAAVMVRCIVCDAPLRGAYQTKFCSALCQSRARSAALSVARSAAHEPCKWCGGPWPADRSNKARHCSEACSRAAWNHWRRTVWRPQQKANGSADARPDADRHDPVLSSSPQPHHHIKC